MIQTFQGRLRAGPNVSGLTGRNERLVSKGFGYMVKFGKIGMALLVLAVLALTAPHASAFLDGTNAVGLIEDNVNNAGNVIWPLVIGIIGALVALSVVFKVGRKGGIRA